MESPVRYLLLPILVLFTACTSPPSPAESDGTTKPIPAETGFFPKVSEFIAGQEMPEGPVAIYPFHDSDGVHPLSDFLVESITAELSRQGHMEMINRKALDQVLEETELQLSGLVDPASTVQVGMLLGASVIVTGYIEGATLVVQIIDVETSGNISGQSFDIPEAYFETLDEKTIVRHQFEIQERGVFDVVVMEDFSDTRMISTLSAEVFGWGEQFADAYTAIQPAEGGLKFLAHAETADPDADGDVSFELSIPLDDFPETSRGFYLKLRCRDSGEYRLRIGDQYAHHYLQESTSHELLVPWSFFGDARKDPANRSLYFIIPVTDNTRFVSDGVMDTHVVIDEYGFYDRKNESAGDIVSFEDQELNCLVTASLYGLGTYMDYSDDDDGVERWNDGITGFDYTFRRVDDGAVGHALLFDFTLEGLNPGVEDFFSRYGEFTLMVNLYLTLPESDAETLQFWLQSETIRDGYFDIYRLDDESVHMAYSDIRITPYWGLLQTPLLDSVESGTYWISMALHIPENRIREALGTGTLTVSLGLDEIGIAAPPGA